MVRLIDKEFKLSKPINVDGRLRDAEDLGQIIREKRKFIGLTQVELAKLCNCSPRFIGDLEHGVAGGTFRQVLHVCNMLGLDLYLKKRGE